MDERDRHAFIVRNTALIAPPLTPEIVLHLASESLALWQKTEEELAAINVPPPYWAFAWAGGQALARYVLDHPNLVASQAVLDVGSGSGLGAIAAAMAGAVRVTAAEIDPLAIAAIRLNATANSVAVEVREDDTLAGRALPVSDVVLVGDMFYERDLASRVFDAIQSAALAGSAVLVGDPRRSYFPIDRFEEIACYEVTVSRDLEDAEIKRAAVWRLRQG